MTLVKEKENEKAIVSQLEKEITKIKVQKAEIE
jgi:hypothetical protein